MTTDPMTFLIITTAVATAIVAVAAAATTKPVRWLFGRLLGQPLKCWVKGCAAEALDESINGGIVHLHRRLSRLESKLEMEPMRYSGEDPP